MRRRRVVSLLPSATEIVAALGGLELLVGISHECDHPAEIRDLPRLTTTPVDTEASQARIDEQVRRLRHEGRPVIAVDGTALGRLAPDLILTQGLCEVCAAVDGEVHRLSRLLDPEPEVLALSASTLQGIWRDIRSVGEALGLGPAAVHLVRDLEGRLARLGAGPASPPRVVCIEWLDPLYLAGHWVPELIAAAGGRDVGAVPGAHSARRDWQEVAALQADVVLVAPCGFGVDRARQDLAALGDPRGRAALERADVWLLDANAYTSRAGPRVVDGAERIRAALEGRALSGLARWEPAGRLA